MAAVLAAVESVQAMVTSTITAGSMSRSDCTLILTWVHPVSAFKPAVAAICWRRRRWEEALNCDRVMGRLRDMRTMYIVGAEVVWLSEKFADVVVEFSNTVVTSLCTDSVIR